MIKQENKEARNFKATATRDQDLCIASPIRLKILSILLNYCALESWIVL